MKKAAKYSSLAIILSICGGLWAANPETQQSDESYDKPHPKTVEGHIKKAEDAGNRALNTVDKSVHSGGRALKKAADKGLKSVDAAVHKGIQKANEAVEPKK